MSSIPKALMRIEPACPVCTTILEWPTRLKDDPFVSVTRKQRLEWNTATHELKCSNCGTVSAARLFVPQDEVTR